MNVNLNPELEHCWVVLGKRIGKVWFGRLRYASSGQTSRVRFTAEEVLRREDRCHDVIGFLHTHPASVAFPSSTDVDTMEAWVSAIGRPLLCGIEGIDGLKCYWFNGEQPRGTPVHSVRTGSLIGGLYYDKAMES